MFKKWLAAVAILLSLNAHAYQQGDQLSSFVMERMKLNSESLTIIDFFAEWCVSCRAELPEVNKLAQQLNGHGVEIIGVDVDEDSEVAQAFQQELGLTFRVINDPEQELAADFQPVGMPALYYVYQGKVLKVRFGAINHIRQVIIDDLKAMGLAK